MIPRWVGVLAAGAVLLGLASTRRKPARFLGDKAQVGDVVFVRTGELHTSGQELLGVPGAADRVMVRVDGAFEDGLSGPVIGFSLPGQDQITRIAGNLRLTTVQVDRASIIAILRNDQLVTFP